MPYTYTAPTPHDLTALDALEDDLKTCRLEHSRRAGDLAALWDRIDRGEALDDSAARRSVGRASAAVDAAFAAWLAEWTRVGKPLSRGHRRPRTVKA